MYSSIDRSDVRGMMSLQHRMRDDLTSARELIYLTNAVQLPFRIGTSGLCLIDNGGVLRTRRILSNSIIIITSFLDCLPLL